MSNLNAEVTNELYWDFAIPRYRLTVEVDHGLVILQGIVERAYERSCAEAEARRVPGVIGVRNEITVRAAQVCSQSACLLPANHARSIDAA